MKILRFLIPVLFLFCIPTYGVAQCDFEELQTVLDPNGALQDEFGNSVSITGEVAIVQSRLDDDAGPNSGSAFIYRFDGASWIEEQKILLGGPVTIEDDIAAIGNSVFRFNGTSWDEETILPVPAGASSVSLDTGLLIIGSRNGGVGTTGIASIFSHDGTQWVLEDTISASDGSFDDQFGASVGIDGKNRLAIVGAPNNDDACPASLNCNSGSSYIFRFDGSSWVEEQKITAGNADRGRVFGRDVSILGNLAVVSPFAYVFRFDGNSWTEEQQLTIHNTNLTTGVVLGERGLLAVSGTVTTPGGRDGVVHIFRFDRTTWISTQALSVSNGTGSAAGDGLGRSVDMSGDILLAGAPLSDEVCPMSNVCDSGSAYFFRQNFDCSKGTVNTGIGLATDVFFINGSSGDSRAVVNVTLGEAVTFSLDAAPAGPNSGNYLLYIWTGFPVQCGDLMTMGEMIGCMVNPTPFLQTQTPQPFRCLRSSAIPSIVCRGIVEKDGPATVPWALSLNLGFQQPAVFTFQGVIQDQGAGNATGYSVTNAATIVAE